MKFDDYILELLSGWNLSFILVSLVLTFFWVRSRRPVDIPPGPTPFPFIVQMLKLEQRGETGHLTIKPIKLVKLN